MKTLLIIEENFVMDRDFFEGVANKNVEIFDVDNKDNSVYVKYKDINGKYSIVSLDTSTCYAKAYFLLSGPVWF